jgi:plasmid stability protein
MSKTTHIPDKVDFRWRQHEAEWKTRLAEHAAKAGRSISDHARELLKTAMVADEQTLLDIQLLRQEVANLDRRLARLTIIEAGAKATHENVYQLRDDLLAIVIKLLSDAASLDPQDAETWVQQTFQVQP